MPGAFCVVQQPRRISNTRMATYVVELDVGLTVGSTTFQTARPRIQT